MNKLYFLQVLCSMKTSDGNVKFVENYMVVETDFGVMVQDDKCNHIEYYSNMKELKYDFVENAKDFNKYCKLKYLGEI